MSIIIKGLKNLFKKSTDNELNAFSLGLMFAKEFILEKQTEILNFISILIKEETKT